MYDAQEIDLRAIRLTKGIFCVIKHNRDIMPSRSNVKQIVRKHAIRVEFGIGKITCQANNIT